MKKWAFLLFLVLSFASLTFAGGNKTFVGVLSDTHCGIKHSGASDQSAQCVEHCVAGGASYVLVAQDGNVYLLSSQDKFKGLGGKTVTIKGALDGATINVASVESK